MEISKIYDMLIVGCGPAGLAAAVNAAIREKEFILVGGGCLDKLKKAQRIDNYLGFPYINGKELADSLLKHIELMGITIHNSRVDAIYPADKIFQVMLKGEMITVKSVIIASGLVKPRYLPGEERLVGKGVSYCATCDAPLFKGKNVLVLGETEEAQEEANFLAGICNKVTYISGHGIPQKLQDKIEAVTEKPQAIHGEERFRILETQSNNYEADGIFILRKVTPVKELIRGLEMEDSYIKVKRDLSTNIPGVFAAGDVTGPPYQIAKAVGEGASAALNAVKYVDSLS